MYLIRVSWFVSLGSGHVNRAAAKHHGDTVRDFEDLHEVVADVDDADAMSGEVAGVIDHPLALHDRERGGWFVHHHHFGLPVNCARDRDRLTLPARKTSNRARIRGNVAADLSQQGRGFAAYGAVIDDGKKPEQATHRFAPQKHIGADRKIVGERQVLVDGLNASLARLAGRTKLSARRPA